MAQSFPEFKKFEAFNLSSKSEAFVKLIMLLFLVPDSSTKFLVSEWIHSHRPAASESPKQIEPFLLVVVSLVPSMIDSLKVIMAECLNRNSVFAFPC